MGIPDLNIPEIQIQPIYDFSKPVDIIPLTINVPACTYQHRDIKNTGNRNLLLDDPNGVFTVCDAPFPSFNPMNYQPNNLIMSEDTPITSSDPEIPEPKPPVTQKPVAKEVEFFIKCPDPQKDQRIGDFRNDKKLERVIAYERGQNGIECITLYEDVPFISQYIPSFKQFTGVISLALVGCSAPIILNLVKPLVRKAFQRLSKSKKDKVE